MDARESPQSHSYNHKHSGKGNKGPGHAVRTSDHENQEHVQHKFSTLSQKSLTENPQFPQQTSSDGHHTHQYERPEKLFTTKPPGIIGNTAFDNKPPCGNNQHTTNKQITRPPPGFEKFVDGKRKINEDDKTPKHKHGHDKCSSKEYAINRHKSHSDEQFPHNSNEESQSFDAIDAIDIQSEKRPPTSFEALDQSKLDTDILSRKGAMNYKDNYGTELKNEEITDKMSNTEAKFEADTQKAIALSIRPDDLNTEYSRSNEKSQKKMEKKYEEDIERAKIESLATLKNDKHNNNDSMDAQSSNKEQSSDNENNLEKDEKEVFTNTDAERQEAIARAKGWTTHYSSDNDDYSSHYNYRKDKEYLEARKKFVYFWRNQDIYSQWHKSKFYYNGLKFNCAEQFMMYKKAELFQDQKISKKILGEKDPRKIKALGREVKGFSEEIWAHSCLFIVKQASVAKFSQNDGMKHEMFSTYPKILVEASPYDKIWGIGYSEEDCEAWDMTKWRGKNWLGYILTEVRDEMMVEAGFIKESDKQVYLEKLQAKEVEKYKGTSKTPKREESQSSSETHPEEKKPKNKNSNRKDGKQTEKDKQKEVTPNIGYTKEDCYNKRSSSSQIIPEVEKYQPKVDTHKKESEANIQELRTDNDVEDTQPRPVKKGNTCFAVNNINERDDNSLDVHVNMLEDETKPNKNQNQSSVQDNCYKLTDIAGNFYDIQPDVKTKALDKLGVFAEGIRKLNIVDVEAEVVSDKKHIPRRCWTQSTQVQRGNDKLGPESSNEASKDTLKKL